MAEVQTRWSLVAAFFGSSFILHLVWESAQMPLFETGDLSAWEVFRMCLFATATGDMVFMAILYAVAALAVRDWKWLQNEASYKHPATWVLPSIFGVLLAISFELWAIHAVERWEYDGMPLVPFLHVGLTPVLQMALIPFAVTWLSRMYLNRKRVSS